MIYSVWNANTRRYDYYQTSTPMQDNPTPALRSSGKGLGVPPEQAAYKLPFGARKVGSGDRPQGAIAAPGGLAGMGDSGSGKNPLVVVAGLGAVAFVAWKLFSGRKSDGRKRCRKPCVRQVKRKKVVSL